MREDNLLAIRQRCYVITTDANQHLEVYLNLAKRMQLTAPNQLWIADLTYIRLNREFVFLAVILDKWSRRAVGWALDRTLAARLAVTALEPSHRGASAEARSGSSFRLRHSVRIG